VSVEPVTPLRPLAWPAFVEHLSQQFIDPQRVYFVGGAVRDALLGQPVHDFDLATHESGRKIARRLANKLGGKFYVLDSTRDVGRVLVRDSDGLTKIDVATFRGSTLLADLHGRDFTINAMAIRLDDLTTIIDPLSGQRDLLSLKILRQCNPTSVADDPVRAIRAVRYSVQFGLRMEKQVQGAARQAAGQLVDSSNVPLQPERMRDELFKLLTIARPSVGLRILHRLGLLSPLGLIPDSTPSVLDHPLAVADSLSRLIGVIASTRDDNTASDLTLGTTVMTLDRYRTALQAYLGDLLAEDRQRLALLYILSIASQAERNWEGWARVFCLSNPERRFLLDLEGARSSAANMSEPISARMAYAYYRSAGVAGVGGVILLLAEFLASHLPSPDSRQWGRLLDEVASPLLAAYFQRHDEVVAPLALIGGDDVQRVLGVQPGPIVGKVLERVREEQAAGEIRTRQEALQLVKHLFEQQQKATSESPHGPTSTTSGS
jgi:poly(A) polymerase